MPSSITSTPTASYDAGEWPSVGALRTLWPTPSSDYLMHLKHGTMNHWSFAAMILALRESPRHNCASSFGPYMLNSAHGSIMPLTALHSSTIGTGWQAAATTYHAAHVLPRQSCSSTNMHPSGPVVGSAMITPFLASRHDERRHFLSLAKYSQYSSVQPALLYSHRQSTNATSNF